MGNAKSSSSQFPDDGNNSESDQSDESAESSAPKVIAAMAGGALLALSAWSLSSSSDSIENKSKKVGVTNRAEAGGSTSFMRNPGPELEPHTGDHGYHGSTSRLIKLMSYNVWFREDVEVIQRMEAIGRLIQKHSPDIILFQEVTPNIYRIFQRARWWKVYKCSVPTERETSRRYFCMLLSKFPARFSNKSFKNSNMGREICFAELDAGSNKSIVVACSHLESPTPPEMNNSKRIAQANEALSHLNYLPNAVFGGDMN